MFYTAYTSWIIIRQLKACHGLNIYPMVGQGAIRTACEFMNQMHKITTILYYILIVTHSKIYWSCAEPNLASQRAIFLLICH